MSRPDKGVYLCVREGVVIAGEQVSQGKQFVVRTTKHTPDSIFESPFVNRFERFFISGDVDETELICKARQYSLSTHKAVYVCSPNILNSRRLRAVPERQLTAMYETGWNLQPSQGGFDLFREPQEAAFTLAYHRKQLGGDERQLLEILRKHPAWPAVSFVSGISIPHAASVLAAIRDPRFFVSVSRDPDSSVQLNSYMGITIKNVEACLSTSLQPQGFATHTPKARCSYVVSSWLPIREPVGEQADFLTKFRRAHAVNREADFEVSKLWLRFVAEVWKGELEVYRNRPQAKELAFDPSYFFMKDADMAAQYKLHRSNLTKVHNDRAT
jgi:hypothetical protein